VSFLNWKKEPAQARLPEIANYTYPLPVMDKEGTYTIAILGTNDIHGAAFPINATHPLTGESYTYVGLQYLASYVRILRNDWGNRFLWLDGGDQFQGGIENRLSNGTIITEFFDTVALDGAAIGNHEFDFGMSFLYERLEESNFTYLAANIYEDSTNKTEFMPNTKVAKIYQVGDIKVGVIGLTTVDTPHTTSGDVSTLRFELYRDLVVEYSRSLKEQGANVIVLNVHLGLSCHNDKEVKKILKLRDNTTVQGDCDPNGEIQLLLDTLEPGTVHAVVAGHEHDIVHHYVSNIPVIQNVDGGYTSHVIYLTFDSTTKKLINTQIEGPMPSCERIFTNSKQCEYISKEMAKTMGDLTQYTFHGIKLEADKSLEVLFNKWWVEVQKYKKKLSSTEVTLKEDSSKEIVLGNLVADCFKNITNSDISIINNYALRSTVFPGDITLESLYNMFPFENRVVRLEMTGEEVIKIFTILQKGKNGFYHSSGVHQKVMYNPNSLIDITLIDGTPIDVNSIYTVSTIDFNIPHGGDEFQDVMSWYTPRNLVDFGFIRDLMIESISKIPVITEDMFINKNRKRIDIVKMGRHNLK